MFFLVHVWIVMNGRRDSMYRLERKLMDLAQQRKEKMDWASPHQDIGAKRDPPVHPTQQWASNPPPMSIMVWAHGLPKNM